jgi:rubrerythrin
VPGIIARWILSRALASGLAFEAEAIDAYRGMQQRMMKSGACDDHLSSSICRLLEEEETHRRILTDAADGRLSISDLDRLLVGHLFTGAAGIHPLQGKEEPWRPDLVRVLDQEQKTWIFYGNLQRVSKIPAVKKAFEVLASMEKEHVEILRGLLGPG